MIIRHYLLFILIYIVFVISNYTYGIQTINSKGTSYEELQNSYLKLRYSNPRLAKLQAEKLLKKALLENNLIEEHKAYLSLGAVESYLGNHRISMNYIDKTIRYAEREKNIQLLLEVLNESGKINFDHGNYKDALPHYLKMDSIAIATNNYDFQIKAEHNIGLLKIEIGEHKEAVSIFKKKLKKITSLKNNTSYTNTLIALASSYLRFNVDSSKYYIEKIKTISLENNDLDGLNYYYTLQGITHYKQKEYDKALLFLEDADSLTMNLSVKGRLFSIYRFQGKCYFDQGQYKKAIKKFEKINELQKRLKFHRIELQEIAYLLANSYEKTGNIDDAITNFNKSLDLAKKNEKLKSEIKNEILQQYSINKLETKISKLTTIYIKKEASNKRLVLISIILSLIICSVLIIGKRRSKQNKLKFVSVLTKLKDLEKTTIQNNLKSKQNVSISDEKLIILINRLNRFETEKHYLNTKTSLASVAKKLKTNTSYLSKIINDFKGQTFSNYITELRINYALLQLKQDSIFRSYSIKAIAKDLGFKSEGSFSRAFKKQTGIYPSFYIKKITSNL